MDTLRRASAEGIRASAEGIRASAEGIRAPAEGIRASAEGIRAPAKGIRASAEGGGGAAEGGGGVAEQNLLKLAAMNTQDQHLNLFRHYAASDTDEVLENNLTRALALCLSHDPVFLYAFLSDLIGPSTLRRQLHHVHERDAIVINIQQRVVDLTATPTIYAVALTAGSWTEADYHAAPADRSTDSPITDLTIQLQETLVLVEVKRHAGNCMAQLKGQVEALVTTATTGGHQGVAPTVIVKPLSWANVVSLATASSNFRRLTAAPSPFTCDLMMMIQANYPHWNETHPLRSIPFYLSTGEVNRAPINQRLHEIQRHLFGNDLRQFAERVAMPIDVAWASEVITQLKAGPDKRGYVAVQIWPGNTKGQGGHLYWRSLAWIDQTELTIDGRQYPLTVDHNVKFAHFNAYVKELDLAGLPPAQAQKFRTREAFDQYAGQWWRAQWPTLTANLAADTGAYWADLADEWDEAFTDSNRNYCNVSVGFYVKVLLPYDELQALDTSTENWQPVAGKLTAVIEAFKNLVEGH